jgi:hypothetical protein
LEENAAGPSRIKILDFGLAKALGSVPPGTSLTQSGEVFGTLYYASPEQMTAVRDCDTQADVYSMGAVLYELLTTQRVVAPGTLPEVIARVLKGSIERSPAKIRPDVPEWLDRLTVQALAHNPAERFADADEMLRALEKGRRDERWAEQRARWKREEKRFRIVLSMGGVLVLLLLMAAAGSLLYLQESANPSNPFKPSDAQLCSGGDSAACKRVCLDDDPAVCRQLCDGDVFVACAQLADIHENARGVVRNYERAAQLYRRACDGSHAPACSQLANLYFSGAGVPQDRVIARDLWKRACSGGDAYGCIQQANNESPDAAAVLLRRSCDAGSQQACGNLGSAYETGHGVPRDLAIAAALYKRACEGDGYSSCDALARVTRLSTTPQ